jgi:catechol 2,3-dioxygenase-like lactoylglutathione lyase family enzyme
MLGDKTIIAFVATADAAKARPFYEETLGLKVKSVEQYAIVFDANGIELRMSLVQKMTPAPYSILSWMVPDIRAAVIALSEKTVHFERYDWFTQDEWGIWTAPGGAQVAWFKDPDGNLLSLSQF